MSLLANTKTAKNATTTPVISNYGSSSDRHATNLMETVSPLQLTPVGPLSAKAPSVEMCRVLLEEFKCGGKRWGHDRRIAKPMVIDLLTQRSRFGASWSYNRYNRLMHVTGVGKIFWAQVESDIARAKVRTGSKIEPS